MKEITVVTTIQVTNIVDVPDDQPDDITVADAESWSDDLLANLKPALADATADDGGIDDVCLGRTQTFIGE